LRKGKNITLSSGIIKFTKMKQKFSFISVAILFFISCLGGLFWATPLLFKGYGPDSAGLGIIMARNLAATGKYSLESEKNVLLSSDQIASQGMPSTIGNKLTAELYAKILKLTGPLSLNSLIFISIFICALSLFLFSLAVFNFFGFGQSVFFSFVYIFLPTNWLLPYSVADYEFGLLFFSLFLFLFSFGLKELKNIFEKIALVGAGFFLSLSGLAIEALFVPIPIIFIFLAVKKQWQKILWIFLPVLLILSLFYAPDFISGKNRYLALFLPAAQKITFSDYSYYAHLFPDPYIYQNMQTEYLDKLKENIGGQSFFESLETRKILINNGYDGLGIFYRVPVGFYIFFTHLARFFSLETIGGPFILLLFVYGFVVLRRKNRLFFDFTSYILIGTILLLSFFILVVRDHTMDLAWAFCIPLALALNDIFERIKNYFDRPVKRYAISGFLAFILAYNFILSGHVVWARTYNNSSFLQVSAYTQNIQKANIVDFQVIATGLQPYDMDSLNYLSDKNFIVFTSETVKDLLKNNKLQAAFDQYQVKYILGYSELLTPQILSAAAVKNLGTSDIEITELPEGMFYSWFVNLVK